MSRRVLALALTLMVTPTFAFVWPSAPALGQGQPQMGKARKVRKTDAEWRKLLTREQYLVTRQKATEPAGSGKYAYSHTKGTYLCVCCGAPLFSSTAKFESGTGWPSFWRPIDPRKIDNARDLETGELRIEVMCMDCGAHLGHVFEDGPPPTGLRFCINSASLKLLPTTTAAKKGSTAKTKKGQPTPPADTASQDKDTEKDKDKDKDTPKTDDAKPATDDPKASNGK